MKIERKLGRLLRKRARDHMLRSTEYKVPPPDLRKWYGKLLEAYRNGFRCEYCGKRMKVEGGCDDPLLWTIDHRVPLWRGGSNDVENVTIACWRCNMAKGALTAQEYTELLSALRKEYGEEVDEILHHLSSGRVLLEYCEKLFKALKRWCGEEETDKIFHHLCASGWVSRDYYLALKYPDVYKIVRYPDGSIKFFISPRARQHLSSKERRQESE